jgi:hypothetical protein
VGDMVTVLHIASCSLQRGQVLAVNTWSEHLIDYLVQFDQVELGHGIVPDDMIAAHGVTAVLHRRRRAAEVAAEVSGAGRGEVGLLPRDVPGDRGQDGAEGGALRTDKFFGALRRSESSTASTAAVSSQQAVSAPGEKLCIPTSAEEEKGPSETEQRGGRSTRLGQDRGSLNGALELLWRACVEEAERYVLTRLRQEAGDSDPSEPPQLEPPDLMKVPAVASLLFLRLPETDQVVRQEVAARRGAGGEELDADVAVSSFLAAKMDEYYEPSSDLSRKLALLFGLANSLSRGHTSSKTLLEKAQQQRAQQPEQYHLQNQTFA